MPKLPINHSKTVMYKIVCNDPDITDIYVGSTTDFSRRKTEHKRCCINSADKKHNIQVYTFIRKHGDWINWSAVPIETYNGSSKIEVLIRERFWIESLNATLNKNIPSRFSHEFEGDRNKYLKSYNELNKKQIADYQKEYLHKIKVDENPERCEKLRAQKVIACKKYRDSEKGRMKASELAAKYYKILQEKRKNIGQVDLI